MQSKIERRSFLAKAAAGTALGVLGLAGFEVACSTKNDALPDPGPTGPSGGTSTPPTDGDEYVPGQ